MSKLLLVLMLLVGLVLVTSCSKADDTQFLGIWEADQADQKVGSHDQLEHYNYLEVTEMNINFRTFVFEIEGSKTQKRFGEETKEMKYE